MAEHGPRPRPIARATAKSTPDFEHGGDGIADRQTGSSWDITGRAVAGPLEGKRLRVVRHDQQFWFSLAAFLPDARIVSTPR